ncbi:hypothetical protein FHL15_006918 [Xylaria flabelliformis]|uniref:Heterokaryon incompatibility domain-containing protein n=1 Tax=Xylaria flabelliformis TaxID=2512241 RepID=A0A553HWI1_9PEZI|nr:hypothetical protein FHL15_006918 [Xylaria flabelliformis]
MLRLIVVDKLLSDNEIVFTYIESSHATPKYAVACWVKGQPKGAGFDAFIHASDNDFTYEKCCQFEYKKIHPSQELAFKTLTEAGKVAKQQGCDYIWIDHCCIDQSDTEYVTRSINLRYQWYAEAEVCLVYLHDSPLDSDPCKRLWICEERGCLWFHSTWSRPVILASKQLNFYDSAWKPIGTFQKQSSSDQRPLEGLGKEVQRITSIAPGALLGSVPLSKYSVATRLVWAEEPIPFIEPPEDVAYSMVGIFGVSLTPNYGEGGNRAFHRLAAKIMQVTSDLSILAWKESCTILGSDEPLGALPHPITDSIWPKYYRDFHPMPSNYPLSMTEKGVQVTAVLCKYKQPWKDGYFMSLGGSDIGGWYFGFDLRQIDQSTYERESGWLGKVAALKLTPSTGPMTFYITTHIKVSSD